MRAVLGLALTLLTAVVPPTAAAQDSSAALHDLPKCAVCLHRAGFATREASRRHDIGDETATDIRQISCLLDGITHSSCASNPTPECICTNVQLQRQVTVCVTANCTIKEALGMLSPSSVHTARQRQHRYTHLVSKQ